MLDKLRAFLVPVQMMPQTLTCLKRTSTMRTWIGSQLTVSLFMGAEGSGVLESLITCLTFFLKLVGM